MLSATALRSGPVGLLTRRPAAPSSTCGMLGHASSHLAARSAVPSRAWSSRRCIASPMISKPSLAIQPVRGRDARLTVAAAGRPDVADRVVGSLPYLIPLLDGLRYGKFFFLQFPAMSAVLIPLEPLIRLYFSFPFAGLIVFFAVYLGICQNYNFSRYVRYNAMQAILLDIILILPGLLESVFRAPSSGFGLQLYISLYNTIWLFVFACVAYGVGSCLTGQTARLPIVGDAADAQVP